MLHQQKGILFDICLALIVLQSSSVVLIFCAFCLSCVYLVFRLLILAVQFMATGQLPHGIQITKGASKDLIRSSTIVKTFSDSLLDADNKTFDFLSHCYFFILFHFFIILVSHNALNILNNIFLFLFEQLLDLLGRLH